MKLKEVDKLTKELAYGRMCLSHRGGGTIQNLVGGLSQYIGVDGGGLPRNGEICS